VLLVNETHWRQGQPQEGGVFECVQMVLNSGAVSFLNDEPCTATAYFVCEVNFLFPNLKSVIEII